MRANRRLRAVCRFAAGKIDLKLKKCPSAEMRRGFLRVWGGFAAFLGGAGRRPGGAAADAGEARGFRQSRNGLRP